MNTFYVIVLGLILAIILSGFSLVFKKIYIIENILGKIVETLGTATESLEGMNKNIILSTDIINRVITILKVLDDRSHTAIKLIDKLYTELDVVSRDTQKYITAEHNNTRNEIKKQAKISSKINSKTKTNKSINHK